jgi:hypothetical protein
MRTRHRIIPLLSLTVLAWGTVSLGTIGAACATNHRIVVFTNYPAEANSNAHPLYWAPEDAGQATFTVERRSHDCSQDPVTVDYTVNSDSATAGEDYSGASGTTLGMYDAECNCGEPTARQNSIPLADDGDDGPGGGVEQARIVLSNPTGGAVLGAVSQVPMLIVDADGGTRVSFDPGPYAQSETHSQAGQATVPVFRAGPVTGVTTTVNYTIGPGANNPATAGTDFTGNLTGTLTFQPGDRVELISFTLVNDQAAEQPEDISISLSNPSTGTALDSPSTMTFTILDNEELNPPNSRFHHPRQGLKYKRKDYRIREVHVFTADDPGGSGVVGVEWAIRRNKGGACGWWTGKKAKFKKGDCQDEVWHAMDVYEPGAFYYDRLASLRPSIGTKIKSYTAFSRAIDGAQNMEQAFDPKRNMNRFEVKRK